jgi:PAS domain S-box-containing protein
MTDPGDTGQKLSPDTDNLLRELSAAKLQEMYEKNLRIELNEACIEAQPSGLVIIDQRGCIVSVNYAAEVLFGYSRKELMGQAVEMLVPPHLRERHIEHRNMFFRDPRFRPMGIGLNAKGLRKGGDSIDINVMLSPLVISMGTYYLAIVHSILPVLDVPSPKQEVLVVEDELDTASMIVKMLIGAGYAATIAPNGETALFEIGVKDYSLALIDLQLPDMSGMDLPARIWGLKKDLPMIAISGDLPTPEMLVGSGFKDWLAKPLRASLLIELITKHIKPAGRAS